MGTVQLTRTAAIFSLGNTHEGCRFALDWILQREQSPLDVYVLYGEAASGQTGKTPSDALGALTGDPTLASKVNWVERWATHAFSIDRAYSRAVELMRGVASAGYPRVYVGITGGSNTMVAAVFHAAMMELSGEVIPIYVQGKGDISIEISEGARTRESVVIGRVLRHLHESRVAAAAVVAADLPASGQAGFVGRTLRALAAWDRFDYRSASEFKDLLPHAGFLEGDRLLKHLARVVTAFARHGPRIAALEDIYRDPKVFYERRQTGQKGLENQIAASGWMLPADALANARRRIAEGLYADAVMRAYRAAEIAIQCRLFLAGVHPSALDWSLPPLLLHAEAWRSRLGLLPASVSFEHALQLLDGLLQTSFAASTPERKSLQLMRNLCYLEHGYDKSTRASAEKAVDQARSFCSAVLGQPLNDHEFDMSLELPPE